MPVTTGQDEDEASEPDGISLPSADSMSTVSPVGPSTSPSAVVASATWSLDATTRRASASARSHRVSPPRVFASIDHEESMTTSTRPRAPAPGPAAREGRVTAIASTTAIATVTRSDTARRIRSQRVISGEASSTRCHNDSDGTRMRGGRSLMKNNAAASATAPARSAQACHVAIAANVMREAVPGGRSAK